MLVRRLSIGALCAVLVIGFSPLVASSASGDKQLTRSKGVVGYAKDENGKMIPTFGTVNIDDDAFAITQANSAAVLRLKDSSEIDIGEKTKVMVGAFNDPASQTPTTIALRSGALHFNIRHPQGGKSNYNFTTATSQIAVRGTEAFLIAGPQGTQLVCVTCAAGDITVTTGTQTITVLSGQTLTVLGTSPLTSSLSVVSSSNINNPAVNQFNPGQGGTGPPSDPTGSFSGSTGIGGAGSAGLSTGALVGGGVVAGTAIAIASSNKGGDQASPAPSVPSPAPSPTPTLPPGPGPLSVTFNFPQTAFQSFPVPFSFTASQVNPAAGTTIGATGTPANVIQCCSAQQTVQGSSIVATLSGMIQGAGTAQIAVNAGTTSFTGGVQFYGAVTSNVPSLSFSSANGPPQNIVLTQAGPTTGFTVGTPQCAGGAAVTVMQTGGANQLTLSIVATSAPSVQTTPACTIAITGQGRGANTLTIPINIYTTSLNVSGKRRKPN